METQTKFKKNEKIERIDKKTYEINLSVFVHFGIGASISIGQEIQCLPYAGF